MYTHTCIYIYKRKTDSWKRWKMGKFYKKAIEVVKSYLVLQTTVADDIFPLHVFDNNFISLLFKL